MVTNIKRERNELLKQIRTLSPSKAQEKLYYLRKNYDWEIPGYRNSLNILSDTAYQDRKHFLLELIQNADDAEYSEKRPKIRFIIDHTGITILYNENGFSIEDIIAITDTGSSTKIHASRFNHGFIGEKGIGFKSVFALASSVEIESPPWHFTLKKEECIVPYPVRHSSLTQEGTGTRLKITFTETESIDTIANELVKIVSGELESFLFLQRLSELVVEDHRNKPEIIYSLAVRPNDRGADLVDIQSSQSSVPRRYYLYSKDLDFSRELVQKRWDNVEIKGKFLKRRVTAAFPLMSEKDKLPDGRLFCYLPTLVTLPLPVFLHVDGQTTADRENLHDPEQNSWNKHLLSELPSVLIKSIISLKNVSLASKRLLDYLPASAGDQQLAPQLAQLMNLLREESFVRIYSLGKDQWAKPEDAIIPSKFLETLILAEPAFRTRAEKYLNKRFVHPDLLKKEEWKVKLIKYGVNQIDEDTFIRLISSVPIPHRWLKNNDNLIRLYSSIQECRSIKYKNEGLYKTKYAEYRTILLHAPLFPLPKKGFGPLISQNRDDKIFWVSSRSTRETGLENSVDYTIVSTEYTYHPKSSAENSPEEQNVEQKVRRNGAVRDLLKTLEVPELNDENILRQLQIPYLIKTPATKKTEEIRYDVLYSIFQKYRGKRLKDESKYDEFIETLSNLSDIEFSSTTGSSVKLRDLLLPRVLRLYPEDNLFEGRELPILYFPKKLWTPPLSKADGDDKKRSAERIRRWKEEWRKFLILCKIRSEPNFKLHKIKYDDASDFKEQDSFRFKKWTESIDHNYTYNNPVNVFIINLDPLIMNILEKESNEVSKFCLPLYQSWLKIKNGFDIGDSGVKKLTIGNYYVSYFRHSLREVYLPDMTWGGVSRDLIPLQDIKGNSVRSKKCIAVASTNIDLLKKATNYLHFVQATTDLHKTNGYLPEYLDALQVSKPHINQINAIWDVMDSDKYDDVLDMALEYHAIGVNISQFRIYDRVSKKLREAKDFCLGFNAINDTPLIEEQYGKKGRQIGEIIGLKEANSPSIYLGLFDVLFHSRRVSKKSVKLLGDLLNHYHLWTSVDQKQIIDEFSKSMKNFNKEQAVVVFNDEKTYNCLYESRIWVVHLEAREDDHFNMLKAAQSIGLTLPQDVGKLIIEDEKSISDDERNNLVTIFNLYKKDLLPGTRSKLQGKLRSLGIPDIKMASIFRVKSIYRVIGTQSNWLPTPLPHFDHHNKIMYVDQNMVIHDILCHLLEISDYGNFEDLVLRMRDIEDQYYKSLNDVFHEENKNDQISTPDRADVESIRNLITESMKRDRIPTNSESFIPEWKCGFDPFFEIKLNETIKNKVKQNIGQGPELFNKKVRNYMRKSKNKAVGDGKKLIDPNHISPKSFFFSEYQERCQVCGLQIILQTNRFYSVTYHIQENQDGTIWWNNQPFNTLCMCPNCHAIAKEGGCNMSTIFDAAEEYEKGNLFPMEIPEFHGDYYVIDIEMNGGSQHLVISPLHMIYFAAILNPK